MEYASPKNLQNFDRFAKPRVNRNLYTEAESSGEVLKIFNTRYKFVTYTKGSYLIYSLLDIENRTLVLYNDFDISKSYPTKFDKTILLESLWRDKSVSFTKHFGFNIITKYIIDKYDTIMSSGYMTTDGVAFWNKLMDKANKYNSAGIYDLDAETILETKFVEESNVQFMNRVSHRHGNSIEYADYVYFITKKDIK